MHLHKPPLEEVWYRIKPLEGEKFETKIGKPFTFEISGNVLGPSRTNYNIAKIDFERAFSLVPFDGPSVVSEIVRGSAYIWAILHDRRVRNGDF